MPARAALVLCSDGVVRAYRRAHDAQQVLTDLIKRKTVDGGQWKKLQDVTAIKETGAKVKSYSSPDAHYLLIVDEAGGWDCLQALLRALRAIADRLTSQRARPISRFYKVPVSRELRYDRGRGVP